MTTTQTVPSAKIIADHISPAGHRLTTMEITCHRFVLAEFNTHRKFSRNSASSRAIPVEKMLRRVVDDPAYPLEWPAEQPGMQGGSELDVLMRTDAIEMWDEVRLDTITQVKRYLDTHDREHRLHKSLINRLLEPFLWHTIIVSSTEWMNFFKQRCSPLAQPEIRAVAEEMQQVLADSTPGVLHPGEWHMPYMTIEDVQACIEANVSPRKVSAARCARVSYLTHDGVRDVEIDIELYEKLVGADPMHASPLEHVATPTINPMEPHLGNFDGWIQLRHSLHRA